MIENIIFYLAINTKFLKNSCISEQQGMKEITLQREKEISQISEQGIRLLTGGRQHWRLDHSLANLPVHETHLGILLNLRF